MGYFFSILVVFLTAQNSVAGHYSTSQQFVNEIVCSTEEELPFVLKGYSDILKAKIRKQRQELRMFLANAADSIANDFAQADKNQAILACATAEELTLGFEQECLDESGESYLTMEMVDACNSLKF